MTKRYIQQFNQFIKSIDNEINETIELKDNKLTEHLSVIHDNLWYHYKDLTGTSAGFYGIDEYIVFSAFKYFIEDLNDRKKFVCEKINPCLYSFKLEYNNKKLTIYRSSSLNHLPLGARNQLFRDGLKLRAPDIAILKEEDGFYTTIAAIEIKNYLDKVATNSAIGMLSQIQKVKKPLNEDHTKYAIFSFGGIFVKGETAANVGAFLTNKNNFLIINNKKNTKNIFETIDLSQFFACIQKEMKL